MQGVFQRDRNQLPPASAEQLGGVARDLLERRRNGEKEVPSDAAVAAAALAAAGAAAGAAPPATKKVYVFPPYQRFVLDGHEHYILMDTGGVDIRPAQEEAYWITPYVVENSLGRPESLSEALPDTLKDSAGDIATYTARGAMKIPPDPDYARLNVDYVPKTGKTMEINYDFIQNVLDAAEKMDYEFALRMQGLLNCGLNAVWTCTDFGFDNTDRGHIMEQFLQKYIGRFLTQVTQKPDEINPDNIVREALQMHSRFSAGWTKEHKRGLAPTVDSCSEALVSHFCEGPLKFLVVAGLTRKEIARFLRRDPVLAPQFGLCLNFFMVKLDQDRNGRNANYKSMFNATSSNLLQLKTLEAFLRSNLGHMNEMYATRMCTPEQRRFEPLTMDWYYVVSQLHVPTVQYTGVKRGRTRVSRNAAGMFFNQGI
jgi:hypothetical protein